MLLRKHCCKKTFQERAKPSLTFFTTNNANLGLPQLKCLFSKYTNGYYNATHICGDT